MFYSLEFRQRSARRQAKTAQKRNRSSKKVKARPLFVTKFGRNMFSLLRGSFPKKHCPTSFIRVLTSLVFIDYKSKESTSKYNYLRIKCKHVMDCKYLNLDLLSIPLGYIAKVSGFSVRTVKRAIKYFREAGILHILRKFNGKETSEFRTNGYLIDYPKLVNLVGEKFFNQEVPVDDVNETVDKSGRVNDVLRYFSEDKLSSLRILSLSEREQDRETYLNMAKIADHKKWPILYKNKDRSLDINSGLPSKLGALDRTMSALALAREITMGVVASSNELGSFLTKKVFKSQCKSAGLGVVLKGVSLCFQDGYFVALYDSTVDPMKCTKILNAFRKVWKLMLPSLYRISHWIGWSGRVQLKWMYSG